MRRGTVQVTKYVWLQGLTCSLKWSIGSASGSGESTIQLHNRRSPWSERNLRRQAWSSVAYNHYITTTTSSLHHNNDIILTSQQCIVRTQAQNMNYINMNIHIYTCMECDLNYICIYSVWNFLSHDQPLSDEQGTTHRHTCSTWSSITLCWRRSACSMMRDMTMTWSVFLSLQLDPTMS